MKSYQVLALILLSMFAPRILLAQTLPVCVSIGNDIHFQSKDASDSDVSSLQGFLQSKKYLNSGPTGYFGSLTVQAVKDFQNANGISPTGYVGSLTREKIKELSCDGTVPPSGTSINHGGSGKSGVRMSKIIAQLGKPSPLTVVSPKGGEVFKIGQNVNIAWQYTDSDTTIPLWFKITLSHPGTPAIELVSNLSRDTRSYSWLIPSTVDIASGVDYRIRVDACQTQLGTKCDGGFTDVSNKYFKIVSDTTNSDSTNNDSTPVSSTSASPMLVHH